MASHIAGLVPRGLWRWVFAGAAVASALAAVAFLVAGNLAVAVAFAAFSHPYLSIKYADAPGVEVGPLVRLARRVAGLPVVRWIATHDLAVGWGLLVAPLRDIVYLSVFFHANPQLRGLIGSEEGLRRARR